MDFLSLPNPSIFCFQLTSLFDLLRSPSLTTFSPFVALELSHVLLPTHLQVRLGGSVRDRFGSSRPNTGFCRTYCGWHSYAEVSRKILKFAFVGNAEEQCPSGCRRGFGMRGSANGWRGVDGMVSIVGHEIAEAATNPVFTRGWFDDDGQENADKCQIDFGPASSIRTVGDRYAYNMVGQGGMRWLIQSNWRPGGKEAGYPWHQQQHQGPEW
ncbi:unnamed protein product [Closterium sp. Naga37s-1]|nr:unnamed protein product [Closterium sp. Naga37s-1]